MVVDEKTSGYGATASATPDAFAVAASAPPTIVAPPATAPPAMSPTNVQVEAPATLEAGYTFDAMYDGVAFSVVVPEGGVVKGQRFVVPFNPPATLVAVAVADNTMPQATAAGGGGGTASRGLFGAGGGGIPTGVWRDGLCDCCAHGLFHPSLCNALCFRPCLVGQLLTRMKMTWLGERLHGKEGEGSVYGGLARRERGYKKTFRNVVLVTLAYYIVTSLTSNPELDLDDDRPLSRKEMRNYSINSAASFFFSVYIFYLLVRLRATMRHTYSIPEESCTCLPKMGCNAHHPSEVPMGWEDICCAIWCQCCVAAQMARHTVDYDERRAVCCDEAGAGGWKDDEAYDGVEGGTLGEGSALVV